MLPNCLKGDVRCVIPGQLFGSQTRPATLFDAFFTILEGLAHEVTQMVDIGLCPHPAMNAEIFAMGFDHFLDA